MAGVWDLIHVRRRSRPASCPLHDLRHPQFLAILIALRRRFLNLSLSTAEQARRHIAGWRSSRIGRGHGRWPMSPSPPPRPAPPTALPNPLARQQGGDSIAFPLKMALKTAMKIASNYKSSIKRRHLKVSFSKINVGPFSGRKNVNWIATQGNHHHKLRPRSEAVKIRLSSPMRQRRDVPCHKRNTHTCGFLRHISHVP